jgi:KDO2-lipid IV(A) lauroyltransferase
MAESVEYFLFLFLHWLARGLSFGMTTTLGSALGSFVFHVVGYRRKVTFENLARAFPELPPHEVRRIALGAYRNYGISIVQMLWAGRQPEDTLKRIVRITNSSLLDDLLARGRGLMILSAHFGSWELIPHTWRFYVKAPFVVVVQQQRNKKIDSFIDAQRRRHETFTVRMGPFVRAILSALAERKVVLMLADQSGPKEAIFVDFLGRPAATHRGAAAFCLKTRAPLVFGVLVRQYDGTYETTFEEIDYSDLTDYNDDSVVELTRRHVAALERRIREHPDQWLWMHKRWKHTEYYESRKLPAEVS